MTSDSLDAMNYFYVYIYMLFDENNPFLTKIEAGSVEKFVVSRFSVYEKCCCLTSLVTRTNHNTSGPSMFMFSVIRADYHAGQIFIRHLPIKFVFPFKN